MLTITGTWLDFSRTSLSKFSSVTSITAPETAETAPSPLVLRGGGGAVARSLKADKSTAPPMAAATADERAGGLEPGRVTAPSLSRVARSYVEGCSTQTSAALPLDASNSVDGSPSLDRKS